MKYLIEFTPAEWQEDDPLGQRGTLVVTIYFDDDESTATVMRLHTKARGFEELIAEGVIL